jgi:hypothetical protein
MEEKQLREEFDTGLAKIRDEIKGRLVPHGYYGIVTCVDAKSADQALDGSTIAIAVKGRIAERSFSRRDIESCRLRVGGVVLSGIISMVAELST